MRDRRKAAMKTVDSDAEGFQQQQPRRSHRVTVQPAALFEALLSVCSPAKAEEKELMFAAVREEGGLRLVEYKFKLWTLLF